jgi:hypothetical protein
MSTWFFCLVLLLLCDLLIVSRLLVCFDTSYVKKYIKFTNEQVSSIYRYCKLVAAVGIPCHVGIPTLTWVFVVYSIIHSIRDS